MQTISNNRLYYFYSTLLLVAIILFPLIMMFQGLDYYDTSIGMTSYQQIFNDPSSIQNYEMIMWLTNIIGGLLLKIAGSSGLLIIRFGFVLMTWISLYFYYDILKKYIDNMTLLLAITITVIVGYSYTIINIVSYNPVTILFYAIAFNFLFKGIISNKYIFLFSGSFILGISMFARFPNISGICLFFAILYYNLLSKNTINIIVRQLFVYFIGFISGIFVIVLLMKYLNHLEYYLTSLWSLRDLGKSSHGTHGIINLIIGIAKQNIRILLYTVLFLLIISILQIIYNIVTKKYNGITAKIIVSLIILACICIIYQEINTTRALYVVQGIIYIVLLLYIFNIVESNLELRLISLFGFLILLLSPLGADCGIIVIGMSLCIGMSIVCYYLKKILELKEININNLVIYNIKFLTITILCIFIIGFIFNDINSTHKDGSRVKMKYIINNKNVNHIYTTKDKARIINELLVETDKLINKNDYIITDFPGLYYFYEARPFLQTVVVGIYSFKNDDDFIIQFRGQNTRTKKLPLIITSSINLDRSDWPNDNINEQNKNIHFKRIIDEFKYEQIWENKYFKIWRPFHALIKS